MAQMVEKVKRKIKNLLPFSVRYGIQIILVEHPKIHHLLQQRSDWHRYSSGFYQAIATLKLQDLEGKVVLEIGPGQYLLNAFLSYQLGSSKEYLIDIDDLANRNGDGYSDEQVMLKEGFVASKQLQDIRGLRIEEQLAKIGAEYFTDGIKSYEKIADGSVDVLYSCSVLQHIRKKEFEQTVKEMVRIMRDGGVMWHHVDLKDMMGGAKKHLGIPTTMWEDKTHYQMDCYTNRLQCNEILNAFQKSGMKVIDIDRCYFKKCPIHRSKLTKEFKNISEEELFTESFVVVLKKVGHSVV